MPDRLDKLRATVAELERELQTLDQLDPETRKLLEDARNEIHEALASQPEESTEAPSPGSSEDSLAGRLEQVARRFEATHPTLAGVLERLVNGLAQLGI